MSSNPCQRVSPFHQLRLEARFPVPRHRDLKRPKVALQTLAARPVSAVPRIVTIDGMLLITQMRRQFRLHCPLDDRLGQLLQQPVLARYVRRRLAPRQQLVNQILRLLHTIPFYQRRSFTQNDLHPLWTGSTGSPWPPII